VAARGKRHDGHRLVVRPQDAEVTVTHHALAVGHSIAATGQRIEMGWWHTNSLFFPANAIMLIRSSSQGERMSGGVFVLKDPTTLVAMKPASFATEDQFQRLVADFPTLLGAVQSENDAPRRWVLLGREKGIQSEDDGYDRFAVDHLFLDQDGIPTLVEVKRQSDTRLRREVVGQMLDYAANAVLHWSSERLRDQFEANCTAKETDPASALANLIGPNGDVDALWEKVKTNLKAGRVRLLFVADRIPAEVRGIVEFLNRQMDPAEVLAIELQQYEGEGLRTIVPTVYGHTEEAQQRKSVNGPKRQWDEASFFDEFGRHVAPELLPVARRIANWIKTTSDEVVFGRGSRDGSIGAGFKRQGSRFLTLQLWTSGILTLNFGYLKAPFDEPGVRQGWVDRVGAVPAITLPPDAGNKWPNIRLSALSQHVDAFLEAMDWLAHQLRASA